jgi:predicted RNA-binding Zn-ribbon protein involved in translation (DUF1610 family)
VDSDLLPAVCPNCGGKLQVDPNVDTLICQFCGTEHIIRRNMSGEVTLEAYARCPLCKRNDQAEKVSAILNKQISRTDRMETRQEIYTDRRGHTHSRTVTVPIQTVQASNLAQQLVPPPPPFTKPKNRPVGILLILAIPLFVAGSCCSMSGIVGLFTPSPTSQAFVKQLVNLLIFGFLPLFASLAIFVLWYFLRRKEKERQKVEQVYINDVYQRWQHTKSRWERLYYCGRDDVVFIPGEKTIASVADMIKHIYALPTAT